MNKNISALILIISCFLMACTNDEIQIDQSLSVRVNLSDAVLNITDLDVIRNNNMIRARLLIYDSEGNLVSQDIQYFDKYSSEMTVRPSVPNGTYRMIAITDIVSKDKSTSFWTFEGENRLSTMKLTRIPKGATSRPDDELGSESYIISTDSKTIEVNERVRTVELSPKVAGAIVRVLYKGIHKFSSLKLLQFRSSSMPASATFNMKSASIETISRRNDDVNAAPQFFDYLIPSNELYAQAEDIIHYLFIFPSEAEMGFAYALDNIASHWAGDLFSQRLEAGALYEATIDLNATTNLATDAVVSISKVNK